MCELSKVNNNPTTMGYHDQRKTYVQYVIWDRREVERMDTTTKYKSNKFGYHGEQITFANRGDTASEPK